MIYGIPEYIRSDNGPVPKGHAKFIAKELKKWLVNAGVQTLYTKSLAERQRIEPGSPWENGYCESHSTAKHVFNGKMTKYLTAGNGRNEFLSIFDTMFEVEVLTKIWIKHYPKGRSCNTVRPHSALGGIP